MDTIKPILEKLNKVDVSKLERKSLEFNFSDSFLFVQEIFSNIWINNGIGNN